MQSQSFLAQTWKMKEEEWIDAYDITVLRSQMIFLLRRTRQNAGDINICSKNLRNLIQTNT